MKLRTTLLCIYVSILFEQFFLTTATSATPQPPLTEDPLEEEYENTEDESTDMPDVDEEETVTDNPFGFLRNTPKFEELRELVQQYPYLLSAALQQIAQENPALLHVIFLHQQAFLRMLREPPSPNPNPKPNPTPANVPRGGAPFSPQATSKSTPQNIDAIETLKALGYPVHLLPQANLVCKKKEIDLTVGG